MEIKSNLKNNAVSDNLNLSQIKKNKSEKSKEVKNKSDKMNESKGSFYVDISNTSKKMKNAYVKAEKIAKETSPIRQDKVNLFF